MAVPWARDIGESADRPSVSPLIGQGIGDRAASLGCRSSFAALSGRTLGVASPTVSDDVRREALAKTIAPAPSLSSPELANAYQVAASGPAAAP